MKCILTSCVIVSLSFLITLYLVPLLSRVAIKFGILDSPDGRLKHQKQPTPYLGGLAIYIGFLIPIALVVPFENQFFLYILASTILLFIGLLDDLIVLTPTQKIVGQALATLCYLKAGFYLKGLFFNHAWNIFISGFWFLTMINAFNLIDVMDGLATTVALGVAGAYLVFAIAVHNTSLVLLLLAFIGALGAFLWFNKPPARIYLGDAGSLFIGGFLASVPFFISWSEYNPYGYFIPLIIGAIPLLEWGTLVLVRTWKRIPFYCGSPDHFCIYLQHNGWKKSAILWYCGLLSCFTTGVSYAFFYHIISIYTVFVLALLYLLIWFSLLLFKVLS